MASASVDSKPQSEAGGPDVINQENVSPRNQPTRQSSKSQVRHRASVACASCRDRRIRCVVPKGERECTQCKRTGTECVIKNDDERRRPISKAYMSSLSDRIAMLEGMLVDKGVVPPPAVHPPKTRQDAQSKQPDDPTARLANGSINGHSVYGGHSPSREIVPSPPDSGHDDFAMHESDQADSIMAQSHNYQPLTKETSPFRNLDPRKEDVVYRLLATKGNLSFDQLSGRLRFFGPTANSHVYSEAALAADSREPPEQIRRSERIIRSLTAGTHEYLMGCFWEHYNLVMPVLDQAAFSRDRESQSPRFYSSFLHITMLAMGYRFADQDREDIRKISLGNRESTLHREAKYMMDIELERPGGIPSVQALLLLGDLECGVGRDNTGWMYSGMATRLAFDIGLHLDCQNDSMPDQEVQIRHMVMKACIVFDKYWSLFLGRPTSIKSQDIGIDLLSKRFSLLSSGSDAKRDPQTASVEIYEYLIELMELAGKIVETRDHSKVNANTDPHNIFAINESEESAYLHVISLDRQLQNWYRRLPDHLTWKPANIKAAPFNYFLLHQQYHVSMILLHRPWAKYGVTSSDGASTGSHPSPAGSSHMGRDAANHKNLAMIGHGLGLGDPQSIVDDSRTSLSRSICTQQAIRVARIFWQHRQRFDGRKMCSTGMQHAGTAAIALIAALAFANTDADRRSYLGYLDILSAALTDMGQTYEPAARMDDLLKAVLEQFRLDAGAAATTFPPGTAASVFGSAGSSMMSGGWQASPDTAYSVLPARREHPDPEHYHPAIKKIRPTPSRRASEFTRPPPPFFPGNRQPTPPGSSQGHTQFGMSHHGSFSHIMPGLYPQEQPEPFNLDFLAGSAIDLDDHDDRHNEHPMRSIEDYSLVASSSEAWGVNGMGVAAVNGHSGTGLELPMGDWIASPANLATGGVPKSTSGPASISATPGGTDMAGGKPGSPAADNGQANKAGEGEVARHGGGVHDIHGKNSSVSPSADLHLDSNNGNNGGMEWMGSEGGLNAMSPASLRGLVSAVDKSQGSEPSPVPAAARNHELDFFSF